MSTAAMLTFVTNSAAKRSTTGIPKWVAKYGCRNILTATSASVSITASSLENQCEERRREPKPPKSKRNVGIQSPLSSQQQQNWVLSSTRIQPPNSHRMSINRNQVRYMTIGGRPVTGFARRRLPTPDDACAIYNEAEMRLMDDVLYRVRATNHIPDDVRKILYDFRVDGYNLGKILPTTAEMLCSATLEDVNHGYPVFVLAKDGKSFFGADGYITLSDRIPANCEDRTIAVGRVMEYLRDKYNICKGWKGEMYPKGYYFHREPKFLMERSAVEYIGGIEYGVHINGIIKDPISGNVKMWMARRSKTKSKYPGMLDHMVAGGQPYGISLIDNVIKECQEEAGIPEDVVRKGVQSVGAIGYMHYSKFKQTIQRSVLFCYDLYLPPDFVPVPTDGEVEEFFQWTIDDLLASFSPDCPDPIKPNCYLVIIDYLIRHGHLNPDVPGYLDVLRELRNGHAHTH